MKWHENLNTGTESKWFYWAICITFPAYFLGALYLIAPILGWLVLLVLLQRSIFEPQRIASNCYSGGYLFALLWVLGALGLLLVLLIGHANFDLGLGKTIKSSIGWAKGWALVSLFILLGLFTSTRIEVVSRAACVVGACALLITPFLILAYLVGLPDKLYVSPLKVLGGSGSEYFTVILYEIDPGNGRPRWRYFAPWAPAVGFVANLYLLCCFFERNTLWKYAGISGNVLMILLSASRMGILVLIFIPVLVYFCSRLTKVSTWLLASIALLVVVFFSQSIFTGAEHLIDQIKESRADSTRVRAALNDLAVSRWQDEAFWFGHGTVENGSHYVEFMPIGSHHNWYGLLFVKGLVGLISFGLPFFLTGLTLLLGANVCRESQLAFGLFLIFCCFSISENIEALAYMTWPAWLVIGIGLRALFTKQQLFTHEGLL